MLQPLDLVLDRKDLAARLPKETGGVALLVQRRNLETRKVARNLAACLPKETRKVARNLAAGLPKETGQVAVQRRDLAVRLPKETGQNEGKENLAVRAQIPCLARARFGLLVMTCVKIFWNGCGSGDKGELCH